MKNSIDHMNWATFENQYKLSDLILLGNHAKTKLIKEISKAIGLERDYIDIECDNYDQSLEIYFHHHEEIDIESLITPENMNKIIEIAGTKHFWVNLTKWYSKDNDNVPYKDTHVNNILSGKNQWHLWQGR